MPEPSKTSETISNILTKTPECFPKAIMRCKNKFGPNYVKCTYTTFTKCINKKKYNYYS